MIATAFHKHKQSPTTALSQDDCSPSFLHDRCVNEKRSTSTITQQKRAVKKRINVFSQPNFYTKELLYIISRQLVVLIPAAWLLARTGVLTNVWFSFLIAEVVSMVLSVVFFKKIYGEIVKPMGESLVGQLN